MEQEEIIQGLFIIFTKVLVCLQNGIQYGLYHSPSLTSWLFFPMDILILKCSGTLFLVLFVCLILRMKLKADKIAQRVKNQILCKCDTMSLIPGTHGEKRELILKSCPRPLDTCHGTYMLSCTQNIKIKRPKLNIEKKHY